MVRWMNRILLTSYRLVLLTAALLATAVGSQARAVTATAQLDRAQVAVGESVVLSIEVEGTQDAAAPQLSGLADFRVRYMGPSTQMRFENGRTSSSITHRYQLFPSKPGRYQLGPFDVVAAGATLRTQAAAIQVVPRGRAAAPSGAPQLRLEARLSRTDPFVGERVPLTIRLLVPEGTRVDELQFPTVEGSSFTVGDMPQPTQRDERVYGSPHRVLYFDTYVIPRNAVAEELVVTMQMSVLEQRNRGGRRGVFGMFGDAFAQRRPLELRSEPVSLVARGLPPAGRPADFKGAVGTFDLKVSAAPTAVAAGDPVTVRVEVSGDGDLSRVSPPRFADTDGFRVYDPVAVKDPGQGKRAIEQVVIPQSQEISELPTLSWSFFDPTREAYRTIHKAPIPLQVAAAQGAPSGVIAQGDSGRAERAPGPLGRDIVYIKSTPGDWRSVGFSWLGSLLFWVVNLLPALAVGGLWWRNHRENLLAANPKLRRFRAAEADARAALAALSDTGDGEGFDGLSLALRDYLSRKLGLPPGAIEGAAVARAMRDAGYGEALAAEVAALLGDMEGLRYSAGAGAADHHDFLRRVEKIIEGVEERKDLTERLAKALAAILVIALCALPPAPAADASADVGSASDTETSFFAGNHAYADGRYADAVERYSDALAAGSESGALHFNLGNAYFKQGDGAAALASYLRARRLLPRDPDVAANLSFAEESLELGGDDDPLWQRILFPIAYRATAAELAAVWTALWWLLCAALAATIALPRTRDSLRWPIRIVAVLALVVLANLLFRSDRLELTRDALVTAAHGAAVRFEPSADGTEHFEAPAGTRLEVDDQRDGWSRVSRRDGRRGWVESDSIVRLR